MCLQITPNFAIRDQINQSIIRSISQSSNQSTNQSIHQSINQSTLKTKKLQCLGNGIQHLKFGHFDPHYQIGIAKKIKIGR